MRVKGELAYDGSQFFGSQFQPNLRTVIGELQTILNSFGVDAKIYMSGRTDKGVHSFGQVFHFDAPDFWKIEKLLYIFQKHLPASIKILKLSETYSNFHSRFDAKERVYRYIFSTKNSSPFLTNYITYKNFHNFDFAKLSQIVLFKGKHNFKSFSKNGSNPTSYFRTISETRAYKFRDFYVLKFKGNSFLRSQVRMMVSALFELGKGTISETDILEALKGDELQLKPAPSNGLYLWKVIY